MNQINLPALHPGQIAVRQQARRFNWLAAGRRWRKTSLCMSLAVETAITGKRVIWGAPTAEQASVCYEESLKAARGVGKFRQSPQMEARIGDGVIWYRSLDDPGNIKGRGADLVIMDEVQQARPEAYFEVLRPMLIDTEGDFWGIGTPKGYNFFREEWNAALEADDSACWSVPTLGVKASAESIERDPHPLENPHIKFSEIERLHRTLPWATFQQDILAAFLENEGAVFKDTRASAVLKSHRGDKFPLELCEPYKGHFAAGVDLGAGGGGDFSVITIIDTDTKQTVYINRWNDGSWEFQKARVIDACQRWKPRSVYVEQNSIGQPFVQALEAETHLPIYPFLTTNTSKAEIIEGLILAFEKREISIFNHELLLGELDAFERTTTAAGNSKYGAGGRAHDDMVMSLALALHGSNISYAYNIVRAPAFLQEDGWRGESRTGFYDDYHQQRRSRRR